MEEFCMKVNGKMENIMVKESFIGKMEEFFMKVNGKMENNTVKESII